MLEFWLGLPEGVNVAVLMYVAKMGVSLVRFYKLY